MAKQKREAAEHLLRHERRPSLLHQGDLGLYTSVALQRRMRLKTSKHVAAGLRGLWAHLTAHLPVGHKVVHR